VVTHPLQIERRPGKVRLSETDVLTTELRNQLIVTMAVSVAVCDIFSVKEWPDLENGVSFVQGHRKWHQLIDRI